MASIGLDLGGTKVSGALFDERGNILLKQKVDLGAAQGLEVGQLILTLLEAILTKAGAMGHQPLGIGVCVPGIAHRSGDVWAPNIKGWQHYPLQNEIINYVHNKIPVFIESDRACHIMGESWRGAARGCRDAIFLAIGTGIGAGIMANGQLLRGAHDVSGAIGWMGLRQPYSPDFSTRGCFETYASGFGIAEIAKMKAIQSDSSTMKGKGTELRTEDVFMAYELNDPVAKEVIDEAIMFWGMAAANLVSIFNPEKIIFGGGVFGPAIKFIDRIYNEALRWAQPVSIQQVRFVPSLLGEDSGLIGAGYLLIKNSKPHL